MKLPVREYLTCQALTQVGITSNHDSIRAMILDKEFLNVSTQGVLLSIVTIGAVIG